MPYSGVEFQIAELDKEPNSGLGISLEGTVDVEDGKELRPHHYIRNILPDGPVGRNGVLQSGDELLEVFVEWSIYMSFRFGISSFLFAKLWGIYICLVSFLISTVEWRHDREIKIGEVLKLKGWRGLKC